MTNKGGWGGGGGGQLLTFVLAKVKWSKIKKSTARAPLQKVLWSLFIRFSNYYHISLWSCIEGLRKLCPSLSECDHPGAVIPDAALLCWWHHAANVEMPPLFLLSRSLALTSMVALSPPSRAKSFQRHPMTGSMSDLPDSPSQNIAKSWVECGVADCWLVRITIFYHCGFVLLPGFFTLRYNQGWRACSRKDTRWGGTECSRC